VPENSASPGTSISETQPGEGSERKLDDDSVALIKVAEDLGGKIVK
jgi:hypothetical protein